MRMKVYHILVNRHQGICQRYHKVHDHAKGLWRVWSWIYLILLNFGYYVLPFRRLVYPYEFPLYEKKHLLISRAESDYSRLTPEALTKKLAEYDVVSFDIFDTLIIRPFSEPEDIFYLIGIDLGIMNFKSIRMEAECLSRLKKYAACGSYEVTLSEIWNCMEEMTGVKAEYGMEVECRYERILCYPNPYMLKVYQMLVQQQKEIIFISDMYLPLEFLVSMMEKCGYSKGKVYLSCEVGKSKSEGNLFAYVREQYDRNVRFIHVGDNEKNDIEHGKANGFSVFHLPNVNRYAMQYRTYDMSPIIGSAYRGLVDSRLYSGFNSYSMNYEFGYVYGGLFVTGYCSFIHEYCRNNQIEKLLFLARDGEVLQNAYSILYPEEQTAYVMMSRFAGVKISAEYMKQEYIRKLVLHKVNHGHTLEYILDAMELPQLIDVLETYGLLPKDKLTTDNVGRFCRFINHHWEEILKIYEPQRICAEKYYGELLEGCKKVAAVDIGWSGSGALALDYFVNREMKISCSVTGIIAGTNTVHNDEPDCTEGYLLTGKLVSYMFSSGMNRDLWKMHNPSANYNIYWELLTSSVNPSFKGFYPNVAGYELRFQKRENNQEGIWEIQHGILDFVKDYKEHFEQFPYMFNISGRDAYAPMLLAAGYHEKYLKRIYREFKLNMEVGECGI